MTTTGVVKHNPLRAIVDEISALPVENALKEWAERGAAVFQAGDLGSAAGYFAQMLQQGGLVPGGCLAIAICYARMGNFDEALRWLDAELNNSAPHPKAWQMKADILAWHVKVAGSAGACRGLTIFTVPKPFSGHIGIIQRNAIRSWLKLEPCPEILLMGNEEGIAEVAREFDLVHIPKIDVNEHGTPLVSSTFELAQQRASNDLVAYVNTDIIFTETMSSALHALENQDRFLVVGRRWDLAVWEPLDLDIPGWDEQLMTQAKRTALLHGSTGIDYFIFRKGLYRGLPPLAVGRTAWDNWLLWEAKRNGARLIDATHAIVAFHQEHPYIHARGGVNEVWRGAEAQRNRELVGDHTMTIRDADYCIDNGRVAPMHDAYRRPEPVRQDYVDLKFGQSVAAYVRGHHRHALDLLAYIELDTSGCVIPREYHIHKAKVLQALGRQKEALDIMRQSQAAAGPALQTGSIPREESGGPAIRLMQVHTFYQSYLEDFYRRHPECSNRQIRLYAGDIPASKEYDGWIGLSLTQENERHNRHDITQPLPFADNSVDAFQAEDVFEHIEYGRLVPVLNEIHRVLKQGAFFRLSVPDYRCDILRDRSEQDALGNIVFDPFGGGTPEKPGHVWFPRYETLKSLLEASRFGVDGTITFLHYYDYNGEGVTHPIDYSKGYVQRTPDFDPRVRSPYRPMSLVVDLTKGASTPMSQNNSVRIESAPAPKAHMKESSAGERFDEGPIRFMQVHTFYEAYLEDFYRQNLEYAHASFSDQINALVRDGFSANHMIAPYLDQLGYEAHLVIANNPRSQSAWVEENQVAGIDRNDWVHDVVRRQIESIRPDVLYLSDPITFDSRFVRSLSYRPQLIVGWRAADIPSETDWAEFDIILSCLSGLREVALTLGAKSAEHFFPGFPVWVNGLTADVRPSHDVVFTGSWTPVQHQGRNALLTEVAADSVGQYSCAFYLNAPVSHLPPEMAPFNKGVRFGVDMYKALRSGRIVLDARARHTYMDRVENRAIDMGRSETANMRIFEATGSGCFLLTEHFDNLGDFFEVGKEIVSFRDAAELREKIHYYLAHPEERETIARQGQERCLRDYSMERRAEEFDRIIRKYLAQKSVCVRKPPAVAELKQRAASLLEAGDVRAAFELLVKAKALRQPQEGLDLMRAHCFLRMNQAMSAIEALKEELRWFPGNNAASQLLEEVQRLSPEHPFTTLGDGEFPHLVATIRPYTMLSEQRLFSLYSLAKSVCERNIPGNFVECGVAAGGSSALLAYVIKRYSRQPRRLFSFDSFSGMPAPTAEDTHAGIGADASGWGTGTCAAPEGSVREICTKLGAADVLTTVKGYFEETLPVWRDRVGMISLQHLDGDWYESTKTILANLYDRISNDGVLQVDDYGHWEGCRKALHEFEADRGVTFALTGIDGTGVWFPKPDRFERNPAIPEVMAAEFNEIDPMPRGLEGQMSPNERFQLYYVLRELLPKSSVPLRFVEVGSFAGGSFVLTYSTLKRLVSRVEGTAVDPGRHPSLLAVIDAIGPEATYLPMFSHQAVAGLHAAYVDGNLPVFLLIDGDHTYEGVRQDIIDYYPLLAPGGIILLHDWLPPLTEENREAILTHHGGSEPGIRQACAEVLEGRYGLTPLELPLLYPTDPTQTQPHLPIIPGVVSTIRAYRKKG